MMNLLVNAASVAKTQTLRAFVAVAREGNVSRAALRLHNTLRGVLRIGTILDPAFTRLGAFLKELVESAPQIETELRQGMSGDVLAQISRGELDVGFYLGLPVNYESNQPLAHMESRQVAIHFEVKELTPFNCRVLAGVFGPGSPTGSACPACSALSA